MEIGCCLQGDAFLRKGRSCGLWLGCCRGLGRRRGRAADAEARDGDA